MKFTIKLFTLVFMVIWLVGCNAKKESPSSTEWKALDAYHDVLAEVYHPLKDSGNVAPARQLLSSLAEKADSLATASLPEKVDNAGMKLLISQITADTKTLADEIRMGASDSVITQKLEPIHDQFHKIHELWSGTEHKEHHKK
jgi:hypothetical protein